MKLMQSGINFFGQGADATYPCSCGCIPDNYATGDAIGYTFGRCGCWCECTPEIKYDDKVFALTSARDAT